MRNRITGSNRLFWEGIVLITFILGTGVVNMYSALNNNGVVSVLFYKHLIWIGIGFLFCIAIQFVNPNVIENFSFVFYVFCCLLLLVVFVAGKKVYGAQRWIALGPLSFQPSEVIKIGLIFFLAKYFRYMPSCEGGVRLQHLIIPGLVVLIPVLMVMKQPDLGTSIILLLISFFMFLVMGINIKLLVTGGLLLLFSSPLFWTLLKDYQKRRIIAFLSPESDPLGAGYHILQAKIAIGTGGFAGKGYLKGVQSKLGYIPEKHTDFIFSVFAEEWGLIGVVIFILLNAYLLFWMFKVVRNITDRFLFLSGAGIIFLFSTHFVINLAMVSGLFPVVGIPLPFFSYGGTALVVNITALSFILKLSRD